MKIFLSYSSSNKSIAEKTYIALTNEHHDVFFDKKSLPASENYNVNIRREIETCDLFVFLISPNSIKKSSYALTELNYFQDKSKKTELRLLPVIIKKTKFENIPNYLASVTMLEPEGNVQAEIANTVNAIIRKNKKLHLKHLLRKYGIYIIMIISFLFVYYMYENKKINTNKEELKLLNISYREKYEDLHQELDYFVINSNMKNINSMSYDDYNKYVVNKIKGSENAEIMFGNVLGFYESILNCKEQKSTDCNKKHIYITFGDHIKNFWLTYYPYIIYKRKAGYPDIAHEIEKHVSLL